MPDKEWDGLPLTILEEPRRRLKEMNEAPPMRVKQYDRVYLKSDPMKAEGQVITIEHGFGFCVTWDTGRTWIYPMHDLELVS